MLLPFANCAPPDPPEQNCGWLAESGQAILSAALDGMLPFIPPDSGPCADTFDTYLTMGPPKAEFYDALSVYLLRFGPTPSAVRTRERGGSCPPAIFPQQQAVWRVSLWENNWPEAKTEGDRITVPAPETIDALAEWVYAHGIAMYESTVLAMVQSTWDMPAQITGSSIGDLTPAGPQGSAVGWVFDVTLTVGT